MSIPSKVLYPNTTQVPNAYIDHVFPLLESSEVNICLFVCRKTFGWSKHRDRISLSQFETGTGLSRRCLQMKLKRLTEIGILIRERTTLGAVFSVNMDLPVDRVCSFLKGATDAPPAMATDAPPPAQRMHRRGATDAPPAMATDAPTKPQVLKPTPTKPTLTKQSESELWGEVCFSHYPKKENPGEGRKAFEKVVVGLQARFGSLGLAGQWLEGRVIEYAKSPLVASLQPRYIPTAANWVRKGKYEEDAELWQNAPHTSTRNADFNSERAQAARLTQQ